ncbi:MAG TPA: hypothetical protein VJX74_17285 [Blastocatellia bacterium]|nr:hypothetical protein [Blastocatellia bacterium]
MSKKNSFNLVQKFVAGVAVLLILLQGPLFTMANPQDPVKSPDPVATPTDDSLDGYTIDLRPTSDVNAFLGSSAAGGRFLDGLKSRGVATENVHYVSLSGNPADPNNDLTLLAGKLNSSNAPKVSSVDMLIGAYQGADGKLDGEVLFVANLASGGQRLIAGFQANDDNLNGSGDPVGYDGDYFVNVNNGVIVAVLCWIKCFVFQQIIIKLRCVILSIILCIRVGPFLFCVRAQFIRCQLIIIIRTIVVCFINCIVVVIPLPPATPQPVNQSPVQNGAFNPRQLDSGGNQNKQPSYTGLSLRHLSRSALAG